MDWLDSWCGYLPPTSNTTYTPNQLFDVVLPHSSRGVVRLVAFMIRKTLGWSDAQGRPQEPQVKVSYRDLERQAGIAQSKLREALNEAIKSRFIQCVHDGRPDTRGAQAVTALYELVWDDAEEYITDPQQFRGFFAGNGNLTYIPNQFFDATIPNETLAVIRVVGTIIRHTIGWQTKFGFRRQEIAMSFSEMERRTRLSRQSVSVALQTALEHRHIVRVESGVFDSDVETQKTAVYGIKWADTVIETTVEGDRLQKLTSIEITPIEITKEKQKQPPAPPVGHLDNAEFSASALSNVSNSSEETYQILRSRGLGSKAALEFASRTRAEVDATWELVKKKQKPGSSVTGLYCVALRENWLEEQAITARLQKEETRKSQDAAKAIKPAHKTLTEKHLPMLQEVFRKTQENAPDAFVNFETFRLREREKLSRVFSLATTRDPALRGFDSESNTLKVFVQFIEHNGCPLPEYQEWIESHPPAELLKMFA